MEMKGFEYDISTHHLARDNRMRIFCSEAGDCAVGEGIDSDSVAVVTVLNEKGRDGWELVQIFFGGDGFICFWKRKLDRPQNGM